MIKIEDYVVIIKNVLSKNVCEEIIKDKKNAFIRSGVWDNEITDARTCYERCVSQDFNDDIYKGVGKILKEYKNIYPNFMTGSSMEDTGYIHLLYKGSNKGHYKEHTDHWDLFPRVLSCSILLNDDYEGGNFAFFEKELILNATQGEAIVFPSNFCFPHAVLPVTKGNRHSIITWIH
jgi:predicted 2-oxoglutarate/Fe(II)-dependent dioxygenase YbiX